jgi:demethylmenaquinone methyltransferase/2-methoxy-6-polyprenyl-1,4-benzoquinol methylase
MTVAELERARAAAQGNAEKGKYVRGMFSAIAPRYDLLNRILSLRLDRSWRRKAIAELDVTRDPGGRYLDLCAGTLDVATAITRVGGFEGTVVGADFSEAMLRQGVGKGAKLAAPNSLPVARCPLPIVADALVLPLPDGCCAGAIVAFGIRNVADLDAALREVLRVLRPGGRFVILEFTTPRNPVIRTGYNVYCHHLVPRIGSLVSGHGTAYAYLPESIAHFPDERALGARLDAAGFSNIRWQTMMLGIVAIHVAEKR